MGVPANVEVGVSLTWCGLFSCDGRLRLGCATEGRRQGQCGTLAGEGRLDGRVRRAAWGARVGSVGGSAESAGS